MEALLDKASAALTPEEMAQLRQMVETLRYITDELDKKKVSVKRFKAMLFGPSSEKTRVGDIYMSLIHTCRLNDVNPFEYLTAFINAADRVADEPERWLPWSYAKAKVDAAA